MVEETFSSMKVEIFPGSNEQEHGLQLGKLHELSQDGKYCKNPIHLGSRSGVKISPGRNKPG